MVPDIPILGNFFALYRVEKMNGKMKRFSLFVGLMLLMTQVSPAQRVITLEDCRRMAVETSRQLDMDKAAVEMAG